MFGAASQPIGDKSPRHGGKVDFKRSIDGDCTGFSELFRPKPNLSSFHRSVPYRFSQREIGVLIKFRIAILMGALLFLGASELEAATLRVAAAMKSRPSPNRLCRAGCSGHHTSIDDVQTNSTSTKICGCWRLRADRAAMRSTTGQSPSNRSGWSVAGDFRFVRCVARHIRPVAVLGSRGKTSARRALVSHPPALPGFARLPAAVHVPALICLPLTLYVAISCKHLSAAHWRCVLLMRPSRHLSTSMLLSWW